MHPKKLYNKSSKLKYVVSVSKSIISSLEKKLKLVERIKYLREKQGTLIQNYHSPSSPSYGNLANLSSVKMQHFRKKLMTCIKHLISLPKWEITWISL